MIKEVIEVIDSYNHYLTKVPNGSIQIANSLRKDEIQEALQMILDFSDGMGWLAQATELLQKNEVVITLDITKIHEFLNEINSGLEIQDYVLVADMFEYEIAPFFEEIQPIEGTNN